MSTTTTATKTARKTITASKRKSTAKASSTKARSATSTKRGPRGPNVSSPAWVASIQAQSGIALKPANLPKLIATAKAFGVRTTSTKPETLVAAVARAMH